jgi:N-acetyl sugar amidotransferase
MDTIPIPRPVDLSAFEAPEHELEAKYGLPRRIAFCRRCVMSNQRPNSEIEFIHNKETRKKTIHFDEDGICDACRAAEIKGCIDWLQREAELKSLCDRYRRSDGHYDCLVPGSGGKDSFFAAYHLKYVYGMHPLTVTWAPHIYTEWGWRNMQRWIHAGFDNNLFTPNGRVHRLLTRLATENLFHPFQPFILGQKNLAPKLAAKFDIPLIFYGENEAEYGNPKSDMKAAKRGWDYFTKQDRENVFLGGTSVKHLTTHFGLEMVDLEPYMPADPASIREKGIEIHYLGYYLKWHPQSSYYFAVEHCGFEPSPMRNPGTYSKYSALDDRIDDFHHFAYFTKFGIGRATHNAAQEIRSGDIERDEGVALVRRYDGEFPERFAAECLQYMSIPEKEFPVASRMFEQPIMSREYFLALADTFRSPHLWKFENGTWALRKACWHDE